MVLVTSFISGLVIPWSSLNASVLRTVYAERRMKGLVFYEVFFGEACVNACGVPYLAIASWAVRVISSEVSVNLCSCTQDSNEGAFHCVCRRLFRN